MGEPRIQYAKTKDGVSIAYWTVGDGAPLVATSPSSWSHAQLEWQNPDVRRWYELLARKRKVIRYDMRGTGLSQRDVTELSLDGSLLDVDSVVERLGLRTFALMGAGYSGNLAISYAARNPERVSHLLLWCTYAGRLERRPQLEVATALADKDWELFTETGVRAFLGWEAGEEARWLAGYMRESITLETWKAWQVFTPQFDAVADLLPQVRAPTLVLHRRQAPWPDVGRARHLAASIPDARLALLEGESPFPFSGDMEAAVSAIDEFLGEGEEAEAGAEAPEAAAFRTVLFTDVEGSTALTQRLGDAKAREVLREHERIVREALKAHAGSELKTLGDGFMASFSSATRALECSIAMQRAFAQHNEAQAAHPSTGSGRAEEIRVRVGLNAGEPVAEEKDLFGTAVNLAKRICDQAKPGQILVSDVVQQLAAGKGFVFADKGEAALKGFEKPVRLHEVRWRD